MEQDIQITLSDWYTTDEASARLAANAGRPVKSHYACEVARSGKIRSLDLGARARLYLKEDVDKYCMHSGPQPKRPDSAAS